jgi:hypothetical protein
MSTRCNCPKCDADISDSYQEYDPDVGIMSSGWWCEQCDLAVANNEDQYDPDLDRP